MPLRCPAHHNGECQGTTENKSPGGKIEHDCPACKARKASMKPPTEAPLTSHPLGNDNTPLDPPPSAAFDMNLVSGIQPSTMYPTPHTHDSFEALGDPATLIAHDAVEIVESFLKSCPTDQNDDAHEHGFATSKEVDTLTITLSMSFQHTYKAYSIPLNHFQTLVGSRQRA